MTKQLKFMAADSAKSITGEKWVHAAPLMCTKSLFVCDVLSPVLQVRTFHVVRFNQIRSFSLSILCILDVSRDD